MGSAPAPGAAERALAVGIRSVRIEANKSGWTVISMKQDWETIFPK